MTRLLVTVSAMIFGFSLAFTGLVQASSAQRPWNVVMYAYAHLRNPNVTDFYMRQTWMHDLDHRVRVLLPFDYEDRTNIRSSEDGTRLLFSGHTATSAAISSGEIHLYLLNSRTGQQTVLTGNSSFNDDADAINDLRDIVFLSARVGSIDVFTMHLTEDDMPETLRQITNSTHSESEPQWLTREEYQEYVAASRDGRHHLIVGELPVKPISVVSDDH